MNIEDRIKKAKIWLITKRPWFGQLSCYVNEIKNDKIPTAAIDLKGNMYYNPEWMDSLKDEELRGVLMHEILHLAFLHIPRCGDRDKLIWNVVADLKVNMEIINEHGVDISKEAIRPNRNSDSAILDNHTIRKVSDKTAENVYTEVRRKMKSAPSNYVPDLIIVANTPQEEEDLKKKGFKPVKASQAGKLSRNWQSRVFSASQTAKGDMPEGVKRELFKLEQGELPWHNILKTRFRKLAVKHSWKKPSKRYLPWYFPGRTRNEGIKVVGAIDTSGSMSKDQISKAVNELYGLTRAFQFLDLWVMDCDAAVYNTKKTKQHELANLILQGGGGTDFRPVFNWIKKELSDDIDCLLFFTDLYGDFPGKKPPYETFWITDTKNHDIPFGRKLMLEGDIEN
jgi:predicted metal-dependent peptidase